MDGRIGEPINSPEPINSSVPGTVTGSSIANSDEPSPLPNGVDICSEVTPKLNRLLPPITLPDKARTVSSADSPLRKSRYPFDFRFVANDDEVRQLLAARTANHQDVTVISHPDDLAQDNLVSRLSISDDGRHALHSGKLFEGSKPLTLVMDIRELTSEELPKFNDLLDPDNPCLYDKLSQKKRPLGNHVALLVLADPAQLAAVGQQDDAPGADFWRRINRPGNSWQFDPLNEAPPVLPEFTGAEPAINDNAVVIDCHRHSHWRPLLLGGPGIDKQGRIRHIPGRLELLKAGQRVILKGANWQDLAFEQAIRQMLVQKSFESNGKLCQLPDDVQFYQMPVKNDELHSLFQRQARPGKASGNAIIINQSNISQWLNPIAIDPKGYAVPNTSLLKQLRLSRVVTVTSPLTETLWFHLLGSLQTIRETTGLNPRLQVAHSREQPQALGLAENDSRPLFNTLVQTAFNAVTYQQPAQASHWLSDQNDPLVIQVNEQTSFSQLFDNIHITSEQKARFGRRQSVLQEALTVGRQVVLRGLESNPTLAQLLEPLLVKQPLLVNGQLQAYPKARVTVLWPESEKSSSSLFCSMIARSKPCPEFDIWDINARRYDLPRAELPEQAIEQLYEAFKTVPPDLCSPLPEMTEGLLNNLILAARRAQRVDQSRQLLARHWRKAINSVITHGTRQNPSVRDFMKVACWQLLPDEDQTGTVDPDRLHAIISDAPRLDREFVKQNLWSLARAFDPSVLREELQLSYERPFRAGVEKETLHRFCTMIVAYVPEQQRQAVADQLEVDHLTVAEPHQRLAIRPARHIKRLQDALASGWQLLSSLEQTRSDAIHALAADCVDMARAANAEAECIKRIAHRLSQSLQWQGSAERPLSALARDLYHGSINQKDRESRRLSRLHDRLVDSPVIFLQGETGTGKSYFSARMARASGQALVISLGPSDSEQTLMKHWQWQEHADGDRSMEQQDRALMEWAKRSADKDGGYITLILDEANLAKAGLLASLNGLWEPEPCIYVNGHPVKVSSKHRVILTGNPDHYAGRQLDPALKEKLLGVYYPPLDQAFLRDTVVEPALVNPLQRHLSDTQINTAAQSATRSVMTLWQYYQELLPEREFTPRDLTDICSWVSWYLDRGLSEGEPVTREQVNGLIQQSFRDVLGPEISESDQDALAALEIWFAARYQVDNTLGKKVHDQTTQSIQQAFKTYTERNRPDFEASGSAVHELVQWLAQDLSRCQQYHLKGKHGGRQATLIEGPAGRGKDATLNLVIESFKWQLEQRGESMPKVFPLNACDCSWDYVCERIQKARVEGGIVVISEMNLIESQYLEGALNASLAGDAHPGFHLFATINPPEYSGRKPLSPALKGRFRHLPIRQYSPAELQTIAEKVLPEKVLPENSRGKSVAKWLTNKHCCLRAALQRKKLPLQPTSLDLQNVARAVIEGNDFTEEGLLRCLNQHYRLYLMAANLSLEALPELSAPVVSNSKLVAKLCRWFNETIPDVRRPWLVRPSEINSIDEKCHEIGIKADLSEEKVRMEMVKMVAQSRWFDDQSATGSDKTPEQHIPELHAKKIPAPGRKTNHLTTRRLDNMSATGSDKTPEQHIPELHAKKIPAPGRKTNHLTTRRLDNMSATGGDSAPEQYIPELYAKKLPALDRKTDFGHQKMPKVKDCRVFKTDKYSPAMYRCWAKDIYVSPKGDVTPIIINAKHFLGFETLRPKRLPGHDQTVTLASNQTLATFETSSKNGQYALPSLTPDDYIVALRTEPEFSESFLHRDVYTGLHTLFIPDAKPRQSIKCVYVVEPRKPGRKTPFKEPRPEPLKRFDASCSKGMKAVLDGLFETLDQVDQHPPEVLRLLQTIKKPENMEQRMMAITDYCKGFSGEAKPKRGVNFFHYLVTRRQGSCRHRVPVFIAFCRYFGIPSRQISSSGHCFAEYSKDAGQTWKSVDLGGAPVQLKEMTPDFQPTRNVQGSSNAANKVKNFLKGAEPAQQKALAKACSMNLEDLNKALETDSALPKKNLSTFELVKSLWDKKDLASFSTGVSMLVSLETKSLNYFEKKLIGGVYSEDWRYYRPMSDAVKEILSNSDGYQVIELLRSLHSKMIDQARASPLDWLSSMLDILDGRDLAMPSVRLLAKKALKLGWLDPLPFYENYAREVIKHHRLLADLESVDELRTEAAHCLKKFYKEVFFSEKSSQKWQLAYKDFQEREDYALFVTSSCGGFSSRLERLALSSSLQTSWTDNPEGVPDIARMLAHHPAFPKLNPGRVSHRPVIIMGQPSWKALIDEKIEVFFEREAENNSFELRRLLKKIKRTLSRVPDRDHKLLDDLKTKYKQAIEQAFGHYLYEVTHSKGGRLTYCWIGGIINSKTCTESSYGAHDPSSPEELSAMMCAIDNTSGFGEFAKNAYLREAHNTCNALVLNSGELTIIAEEFLNSLNLNSGELVTIVKEFLKSVDFDSIMTHWKLGNGLLIHGLP
ncbi:AAA family ATPase [Endozoicomonas sp. 4G]|uniref:AAA family ATPase n=1 Tax=Endozoicomonas sp. 4G TaxID=2872754 RepID=UPI0020790B8A|nr:AAA family ATPase [Endozoicomonas sp. 4G]